MGREFSKLHLLLKRMLQNLPADNSKDSKRSRQQGIGIKTQE
jgi:hypothetical protein